MYCTVYSVPTYCTVYTVRPIHCTHILYPYTVPIHCTHILYQYTEPIYCTRLLKQKQFISPPMCTCSLLNRRPAHSLPLVLRAVRPHHATGAMLLFSVELSLVEGPVSKAEKPLPVPEPVVPITVVNLTIHQVRAV